MIKIALIEDDAFLKEALVTSFKNSKTIDCIMSASSAENFFKYYTNQTPLDILLVDIGLPGMSGIQAILKLKQMQPNIHAIVLSSFHDNDTIFKALRAGATGYLLKDDSIEEIEQKLMEAMEEKPPLSPAIANRILAYFSKSAKKIHSKAINLTHKEKEALRHLIDGASYKIIADRMSISLSGVRYHIKNIYKKLHVNARSQVLKMYMEGELGIR